MNDSFLCVHATSQIERSEQRIRGLCHTKDDPSKTYVVAGPEDSCLLSKTSLIDGNQVWALKAEELVEGYIKPAAGVAEPELLQRITGAIRKSDRHSPRVKKAVGSQF
ncbi:hypothetical protein [Corynebacterium phocae]|nr:hypothetical protein [Corynebacterium phocae]